MYKPNYPSNSSTKETINIPPSNIKIKQPHPTTVNFVHNLESKGMLGSTHRKTIEIQPNRNSFMVYNTPSHQ